MAPLPLLKIFAVLFKEISKPLAASVRKQAVDHPNFKQLAMTLGRGYDNTTQRIERTFSGNRTAPLKPVTDAQALHIGADLISQGFLLSTAIGLVCIEYWRGLIAKEAEKQATTTRKENRQAVKEERLRKMEDDIVGLQVRLSSLETSLQGVEGALSRLADQRREAAQGSSREEGGQQGGQQGTEDSRTASAGRKGWLW